MGEQHSTEYLGHHFFFQASLNHGHLDGFHALTLMNKIIVHRVKTSFQIMFFYHLDKCLRMVSLDYMKFLLFVFGLVEFFVAVVSVFWGYIQWCSRVTSDSVLREHL